MNVFYCLIHLPGAATPELDVLDAETLSEALARLVRIPRDWPGLHGVELYCCNDLINRFQANKPVNRPTSSRPSWATRRAARA